MNTEIATHGEDFAERVRINQQMRIAQLQPHYDFVVCGAGSAGSVVAARLAENATASVLLIEAGGSDEGPAVTHASHWPANLGSERDWCFSAQPDPRLNERSIPMSAGKVLGGGSSINLMIWAQGHRSDWDFFAAETGDPGWSYESALALYRRIEDWHGAPDSAHRGTGGPVFVQPAPNPGPAALAMLEAARAMGMPVFESQNGRMMEGSGGASLTDLCVRNGRRVSPFRSYVWPLMDRPNLTVLTHAEVTRLLFEHGRASGVEVQHYGNRLRIAAGREIVLSLGAIHTPKVLMQSGVGDEAELAHAGIPVAVHLPGVGCNLQDHVAFGCIWQYREPIAPRNNGAEATLYWKSDASLKDPDLLFCQAEYPVPSAETARLGTPAHGWTMFGGLARPKSRGRVTLSAAGPADPVVIQTGMLSHPDDMKAALACVELSRAIGNSPALRGFVEREAMPGKIDHDGMVDFVRNAAVSYGHVCGTAKMGIDPLSVVDGQLRVYGIDGLRIADASIMPRVTTGNTMAPCVVIGERAAQLLRGEHGASPLVSSIST